MLSWMGMFVLQLFFYRSGRGKVGKIVRQVRK